MSEFLGKDAVLNWVYSGGTVSLTGEYRTFNSPETQDKFDSSTSSAANKRYVRGQTDFTLAYQGLALPGGTALEDALLIGTDGSVIYQPEGTATGKRKVTYPCFTTKSPLESIGYSQLVEVNIAWQGNGAIVRTTN